MNSGPIEQSFWTEGLSPILNGITENGDHWDAIVVGAGYAGLSCSRELARSGKRVLVLEAGNIGEGASSKAAGSLANLPKAKLGDLSQRYGSRTAERIYRECTAAREFTERLIEEDGIACDLIKSNRVLAAHSEKSFRRIEADAATIRAKLPGTRILGRDELAGIVGSSSYFGGLIVPDSATVNPAKYQFGLARRVQDLGVQIVQSCRVTNIRTRDGNYVIGTVNGTSHYAPTVVIATNAETATNDVPMMSELGRNVAPVPSYVVVTAPMETVRIGRILSGARIFGDTCKVLNYFALSPCGTRLVLSARAGFSEGSTRQKAERILADMIDRFPDMQGVRMEYYWTGRFAITEDLIPHIGERENVHWVLGCCGTGITMSSYLGFKVARRILGSEDADTVFRLPMSVVPGWKRNPSILSLGIKLYRVYDRYFN